MRTRRSGGGAGWTRTTDRRIMSPLESDPLTCADAGTCRLTCGFDYATLPVETHRFAVSHGHLTDVRRR
jgi:hypothetical protein